MGLLNHPLQTQGRPCKDLLREAAHLAGGDASWALHTPIQESSLLQLRLDAGLVVVSQQLGQVAIVTYLHCKQAEGSQCQKRRACSQAQRPVAKVVPSNECQTLHIATSETMQHCAHERKLVPAQGGCKCMWLGPHQLVIEGHGFEVAPEAGHVHVDSLLANVPVAIHFRADAVPACSSGQSGLFHRRCRAVMASLPGHQLQHIIWADLSAAGLHMGLTVTLLSMRQPASHECLCHQDLQLCH